VPQGYPPGYSPTDGVVGNWSPSEVVGFAWDRIKADPVTTIGAIVVGSLIAGAPGGLADFIAEIYWGAAAASGGEPLTDPIFLAIKAFGIVIGSLAQAFMMAGMMNFSLKVARGQTYAFSDIFEGSRWFLPVLGINFLSSLGVALGLILLIIPGVFLALSWCLAVSAAVDRNLGPIEALSESFKLTDGHRLSLLLFFLILAGLGIVGLCACFVGVVVAMTIGQLAIARVYTRLTGTAG